MLLWVIILAIAAQRAAQQRAAWPAKRAAAIAAAKEAGILDHLTLLAPNAAGWTFRAMPGSTLPAMLTTRFGFRSGAWYLLHAGQANCSSLGDCGDHRSIGGLYGPGSLQVVLNHRTGEGFIDYDQHSPYDGWQAFLNHAGEM